MYVFRVYDKCSYRLEDSLILSWTIDDLELEKKLTIHSDS